MEKVCEKYRIDHGANIRTVRCAKRISQQDLAERLGITPDELNNYENQERIADKELKEVANALSIPIDVLKYMPSEENSKMQIFKDVNFTNSSVGLTQNSFTSYYNDPDTINTLKENIEMLKSENKLLKEKLSYYETK